MHFIVPILTFFLAITSCISNVEAIKEKELVDFLQQALELVSDIPIPDVHFKKLNLYANATNISLSNFTLKDLQLTIPDESHMQFTLIGMGGNINLDLAAGLTGPVPVDKQDKVKGELNDTKLLVKFKVAKGNAQMSKVQIKIGGMSLDFGEDILANLLSELFVPFFVLTLEDALPAILLLLKNILDFQHLMSLVLKVIPFAPLPNVTVAFPGYDLQVAGSKINKAIATVETFSIQNQSELVFDMQGVCGNGHLSILVGKPGMEKQFKISVNLNNTAIKVVSKVVGQEKVGNLELDYVFSKLDIGSITLATDSKDPIIIWLLDNLQSLLKSLLEEGFDFLLQFIFAL